VIDILTEDDGLVESVGGLKELGDLGCNGLRALLKDEIPVEVLGVVFPILDEIAPVIGLEGFRTLAIKILVEADTDNLIGS